MEKQKFDSKKAFQLVAPGQKKPLVLLAESEAEKAQWVDHLIEAISLSLDQAEDLKSRAEEDAVREPCLLCFPLLLFLSLSLSPSVLDHRWYTSTQKEGEADARRTKWL